jgi:arylsulfatase A-like enzyme
MAPTILAACGLEVPCAMLGSDVFTKNGEEPILFCTHYLNQNQRGMRMGKWKLIENVAAGEMMLFDMISDPGEKNNLFADFLTPREGLLKSYQELLAKHAATMDEKKDVKSEEPSATDAETEE